MTNGTFYLFKKVSDSKSVVLTAAGKKEFESSAQKSHMKFIGECNEQGILLSAVKKEEPKKPAGVSDVLHNDAKKSVEEILNTPAEKGSELSKELTHSELTAQGDPEVIDYGHQQ